MDIPCGILQPLVKGIGKLLQGIPVHIWIWHRTSANNYFGLVTQWGFIEDLHSFNTEMERWGNIFIKALLLHLFLFDAEAICFLLTATIIWNGAMLHCRNIIRTGMWETHLVHSWPEFNVTTLFSLLLPSRGLFPFQHSCGVGEYIICIVPVPF